MAIGTASAQNDPVGKVTDDLGKTVTGVAGGGSSGGGSSGGGSAPTTQPAPAATPSGYVPPLHGTDPHGEGSVATTDLLPSGTRPEGETP